MHERMNRKLYFMVGLGGMIGSTGRYGTSLLFDANIGFPFATLTVNLIGCFFLSFLLNHPIIKRKLSPDVFTALGTGMIGSFTTFSTFAVETVTLWHTSPAPALIYVFLSVCGGLGFCYGGYKLAPRNQVVS